MAVRSFRWLVTLALVSVLAVVGTTVYLAATTDDDGALAGEVEGGFELDEDERDDDLSGDEDFEEDLDDDFVPFDFGDDPYLDELYVLCEEGEMIACDDLYLDSPGGSAYEEFGSTCGYRDEDLFGECDAELGDDDGDGAEDELDEEDLAALHEACADGDMQACDELYFESPIGSDEEEFGSTCGGREEETNGDCA